MVNFLQTDESDWSDSRKMYFLTENNSDDKLEKFMIRQRLQRSSKEANNRSAVPGDHTLNTTTQTAASNFLINYCFCCCCVISGFFLCRLYFIACSQGESYEYATETTRQAHNAKLCGRVESRNRKTSAQIYQFWRSTMQ